MNANDAQTTPQGSGTPLQLAGAACCCPECCSDEECAATDTPCC
ncbi:MAG TPA: hypothetical protein VKR80_06495 [Candidatus Limnocylindria bacterium]|nr:hypothetical protein [Candidatus Limnocylindria bacterium]